MDINAFLREQILRPGRAWLQGAVVTTASHGTYGSLAPYHCTQEPFPVKQQMYPLTLFAPTVPYGLQKIGDLPYGKATTTATSPYSALPTPQAGNVGHGQAPTSGIYTGVEDHCG